MLKRYGKSLLIIMLCAMSPKGVLASENHASADLIAFLKSSFVMSLSAGPSWEKAGENQTIDLTPDITKTYTADKPSHTLLTGELFLGIAQSLREPLEGQIGLALETTGNAQLSGHIWDDADPAFNNYIYGYKIQHNHIALKGKLLYNGAFPLSPWISASLGAGFNRARKFNNTPTIFEAIANADFASDTTRALTYTLGIGIQRQLTSHWEIGAGYEFADWGKSQLGKASNQSSRGLSLSHIYTNSLIFTLTYR